jgi:hypothetical protein
MTQNFPHNVSQRFTTFHNVSQRFTTFHNVSQRFTTFHNVSQRFTTFLTLFLMFSVSLSFAQSNNGKAAGGSQGGCGITPEMLQKIAAKNSSLQKWVPTQPANGALLRGEAACSKVQSTKFIKLHFHYLLKNDGTGNFRATDDGYVGTAQHQSGVTGDTWAQGIVNGANARMAVNYRNWLPNPNPNGMTPALPKRVQYILGNVSYHCSDFWYNSADNDITDAWGIDNAYGAQDRGQSVHVYMIAGNDGDGIAQYIPDATTVYPSLALKLNTWIFRQYSNPFLAVAQNQGHLLNHEMGHLLGLWHDISYDLCADTGEHPLCGGDYVEGNSPCGSWANVSNNVMTYGNPWQEALTPCQIDRMQTRLLGNLSSYVEQCVQECSPANPSFTLTNNVLCSKASQTVTIFPNNTANSTKWKVNVKKPNGQEFANAWQTGSIPSSINLSSTLGMNFTMVGNYTITLYADNFPSCPGEEYREESLTILSISDPQCKRGGGILRTAASVVTPNPSQGSFSINYELTQTADISMMLIDPIGNLIKILLPMGKQPIGVIQKDFQMNLQPGLYQILVNENGVVEKFPLTIAR